MMSLRRRALPAVLVVATVLTCTSMVQVATAPAASAACAGGSRTLSGTVAGEDGRFVSAQVSFDLIDAAGRPIGMDGCPSTGGYARTVLVNNSGTCCFRLPAEGSATSPYNGVALTTSWTLTGIPSNAAMILIETYTKRAGGQPNTSTARYGHSLRRVPFTAPSVGPITIVQPLRCGLPGDGGVSGSTGGLTGRVFHNGTPVTATRVSAFSTDRDDGNGGAHLSMNVEGHHPSGGYLIDALAPGTYTIFVEGGGAGRRIDGLRVDACRTSVIDVAVAGSVPRTVSNPVVGDWNGNGSDDVGSFRPWTREWLLRDATSAGPPHRRFGFGGAGDLPVVGDWDGDGSDDVGVYRPSTREWLLGTSASGGGVWRRFGFGGPGDLPVVGDWDGDGDDDIGVYRPSLRQWLLRNDPSGGGVWRRFGFGGPGDLPVVGDWDGDGDDEIGTYRPSLRQWLLRNDASGGGAWRRFGFGGPGDLPVVGDWDADGDDEVGVYRPSSKEWLLRNAASGGGVWRRFVFDGGS